MILQELTKEQREANARTHIIGVVDECYACITCEIKSWNAWQQECMWWK